MEVDLRREKGTGAGKDWIELTLHLGGPLTPEQASQLRAVSGRCPVHRMLAGGVEIVERY